MKNTLSPCLDWLPRPKPIMVGAVLIAMLLLGSILFIGTRPSPMPVTVRHIKSVQSSRGIEMTFEMTNHTTTKCSVFVTGIEVYYGAEWRKCFDIDHNRPGDVLGPHGVAVSTVDAPNALAGHSLRLRMVAVRPLTGLAAVFRRLELRLRGSPVSLSPFNKGTVGFKAIPIVSDEFVEPEPNLVGKRVSEK